MNNINEFIQKATVCACAKGDCFAYKDGGCSALTDSDFGKRKCPFFKTKEQVETEREAAEKRMRAVVGSEV